MVRNKLKLGDLNIPLFRDLPKTRIQAWEKISLLHKLDTGENLVSKGDVARCFFIILKGGLRLVEHTASGKAVSIKVYGTGDMIGLLSLTQEHTYVATVEAIDETQIISFRSEDARQLIMQDGVIGIRLIDHLTNHVHHAHDRIRTLAAEKTEQRLARSLLHLYLKFGENRDGIHSIVAEISQRDVAEFTGTTLETTNRQLRNWEKQGWIRLAWKQIDILEPDKLQFIATAEPESGYMPE